MIIAYVPTIRPTLGFAGYTVLINPYLPPLHYLLVLHLHHSYNNPPIVIRVKIQGYIFYRDSQKSRFSYFLLKRQFIS